jgi:hypothetical protein
MDTDHDGYLSSQEFRQAGSRSMQSGGDLWSHPQRKSNTTPKKTP